MPRNTLDEQTAGVNEVSVSQLTFKPGGVEGSCYVSFLSLGTLRPLGVPQKSVGEELVWGSFAYK